MSVAATLRIQPADDENVRGASVLQVRVIYPLPEEEGQTPASASSVIHLDDSGHGKATLDPVDHTKTAEAIIENLQGQELHRIEDIGLANAHDRMPVIVEVDAALLKKLSKKSPPPQQPYLRRSGYFDSLADQPIDFREWTLSVDVINDDNKKAALLKLLGKPEDSPLANGATIVPKDAETLESLGALDLSGAELKFDGGFSIQRPINGDIMCWAWVLKGPNLIIGLRIDPPYEHQREDLRIFLPFEESDAKPTDEECKGCSPRDTPLDVEEQNLLNNPEQFGDDPGTYCRPFSNPARILGERRFHTIFRVEQPEIESTSSVQPDYNILMQKSTVMLDLDTIDSHDSNENAETRIRSAPANAIGGQTLPVFNSIANGARFINDAIRKKLPPISAIDYLPLPRIPWRNRREPVGPDNPIDWDGNPSQYQSLSVAGGHIFEWRVQWRSNGYSLGNVAHTLTLAPRQTRRIVKLDWQRRETSSRTERTTFAEEVSQATDRERDYSNAVRSSLNEWSQGGSSSKTTSAAGGLGFAMQGFVIGGGAAHGSASSNAWQEGERSISATEEQHLRDAIRQYGDSLRQFESTVVNEVDQSEQVEGVSEAVRNPNYCHSLTVIYHEILRHIRVDTVLAGVRECLFVPFSVRPFTLPRLARWKNTLEKSLAIPELRWAMKYLDDLLDNWENSPLPEGERREQPLEYLSGSLYIKLGIERPKDEYGADELDEDMRDEGVTGERITYRLWDQWAPLLPFSVGKVVSMFREFTPSQRDAYFQKSIAPAMARRWVDTLKLTDKDGTELEGADFTLAGDYDFNGVVRVDFQVPVREIDKSGDAPTQQEGLTRKDIEQLSVKAVTGLPVGSFANVAHGTIDFRTIHYGRKVRSPRYQRDLISAPMVTPDGLVTVVNPEKAVLDFPSSAWEKANMRDEVKMALNRIVDHINENLHHYHKLIWWTMDRDELFMMLDGFALSDSDRRSIASVVERDPIAIAGNSLVFRVSSGAFLGINGYESPTQAMDRYTNKVGPSMPMRVSLPTGGLYAQAIMDDCNACEEHEGSTDWVLNDEDPALADFPAGWMDSRRAEPQGTTPSNMPDSIINLQNAPAAPNPQGFADMLNVLGSSNAFGDKSGLAGTQKNALSALNAAGQLASKFGGFALTSHLAELEADKNAGKNFDKKRAAIDRAVKKGSMSKEVGEKALRDAAEDMGRKQARGVSDKAKSIVDAFGNDRDVSVSETTPDGSRSVSVSSPQSSGSDHRDVAPVKELKVEVGEEWVRGSVLLADFGVGSSSLTDAHKDFLRIQLLPNLADQGRIPLIEGHTSETGSASDNLTLSEQRAKSVRDFLVHDLGLPSHRILTVTGVGENQPIDAEGPLEDPAERSVLLKYEAFTPVPVIRRPDVKVEDSKGKGFTRWKIRLQFQHQDSLKDLFDMSPKDLPKELLEQKSIKFELKNGEEANPRTLSGQLLYRGLEVGIWLTTPPDNQSSWTPWVEFDTESPMKEMEWHGTLGDVQIGTGSTANFTSGIQAIVLRLSPMENEIQTQARLTRDDKAIGIQGSSSLITPLPAQLWLTDPKPELKESEPSWDWQWSPF